MDSKWVAIWGNALTCDDFKPANYAKDVTLRYTIVSSATGNKLRFRFSNTYGYEDVTLSKVTVGKFDDNGYVIGIKPVTFNEKTAGVICKGEYLYSDEIDFSVAFQDKIALSIYLSDYTDLHTAIKTAGPLTNNLFASGDFTQEKLIPGALCEAANTTYFLDTVETKAQSDAKSLITFGDSITAQSWPEWLALRLINSNRSDICVVRKGISGSRVLREYNCLSLKKYGHAGVLRFEQDVSNVAGADRVFVLHGINDIIHPQEGRAFRPMTDLPTADDLIAGFEKYIEIAHKHNLKIYFATITPFNGWSSYEDTRDQIRAEVNAWIRSNTIADGFIDFDKAVQNSEDTTKLKAEYDSGDHLHPSLEGGKAIAQCIPENFLK